ncbi:Ankyrin-1 [Portunus trituberculatus]|uniref:Ankyrin-1 n=2 Tax=Portunus trituberculatus TaxID=210409 RepID=A0A5B7KDQ2_PORTR|nr:Ankyrin-1 [Portunus trituberculatus]
MTALHYAAQEGHQQCVAILIRVIPPFPLDIKNTPLHLASRSGRVEVMKQLADAGWPLTAVNRAGATPLHWAAMGGSVVAAEWLVQRCGNPLVKDNLGRTPLDIAVLFGCHEVETWLTKNGGSVVRREDQYRMMVVRLYNVCLATPGS